MSNEELVTEMQKGNTSLLEALWEGVRHFVHQSAYRYYKATERRGGLEVEDLMQVGFEAMVDAIPRYDPAEASFLTYLAQYLRKHFQEATGRTYPDAQGRLMPKDALNVSLSLNATVDEDGETEMIELVEDEAASCDSAEDKVWRAQLRDAVAEVLKELPEEQQEVLYSRFWQGKTYDATGADMNMTGTSARQIEGKALRTIRQDRYLKRLKPFHNFDCYRGTGLAAFKHSGMSVQERYIITREKNEQK
jgi:RNA polymerase sigma factor (sigma-70 family)